MPQFVIEREMPGVGKLSQSDLKGASQGSCTVIRNLGPEIQWVHSYVTDDKIYCVYRAPSEDLIRKQGQLRDKTFNEKQNSMRDRMRGKRGEQNLGDLQQDQKSLRDRSASITTCCPLRSRLGVWSSMLLSI